MNDHDGTGAEHGVPNAGHSVTGAGHGIHVEPSDKRVRAVLAGEVVADSTRPLLVWERPHHPAYYFPPEDVRTDLISDTERTEQRDGLGEAHLHTLRIGERAIPEGVITYPDNGLARFEQVEPSVARGTYGIQRFCRWVPHASRTVTLVTVPRAEWQPSHECPVPLGR